MKFFTPDLLGRFGSKEDEVALAAQETLEKRSEEYLEHLKTIQGQLPERLRELLERFYLHDARLLSSVFPMLPDLPFTIHWAERMELDFVVKERGPWPSLFLAIQVDTPPKEVLVLHYRSVVILEVNHNRPWQEERLPFLEWQHDEVDVVSEKAMTYTLHSILFSNGIELRLQFNDFDFATMKPLAITSPMNGHSPRK